MLSKDSPVEKFKVRESENILGFFLFSSSVRPPSRDEKNLSRISTAKLAYRK